MANIFGSENGETLTGTADDDNIMGQGGNDTIFGLEGRDTLLGGTENDVLYGGAGNDSVQGGDGDDFLFGQADDDTVLGGLGTDRLFGGDGNDTLEGGGGNDRLEGDEGNDTLRGDSGDDILNGGAGTNTLFGGADNDILIGDEGTSLMDGGAGIDLVDYSNASSSVAVSLQSGVSPAGAAAGDSYISIENLTGSAFGDFLFGSTAANTITGNDGNDTIEGGAGDDSLFGNAGNDSLDGGDGVDNLQGGAGDDVLRGGAATTVYAGFDTLSGDEGNDRLIGGGSRTFYAGGDGIDVIDYSGATAAITIDMALATDQTIMAGRIERLDVNDLENIDGSAFNDRISGNGLGNLLAGGNGDDVLGGRGGNDTLNGGAGQDTADYSSAAAAVNARLNLRSAATDGDGGSDVFVSIENLTGSAFNDILVGDAAANVLTGGLGGDILIGLAGNDILIGGMGTANTLQGGLGDDVYVVEANDTLVEFSGEGTDTVQTNRAVYALRAHFENLTYTGSAGFTGSGNAEANVITGGSVRDLLQGLAGDDILVGRGGQDVLQGGDGVDTVDYSAAAAGVSVRLAVQATLNDGDGAGDTLSSIENVIGSAFNDQLFGDAGGNVLSGGLGADILLGLDGNDTLRGGSGAANTLQGGLGDDTYLVEANDTVTEFSGQGTDTVHTTRAGYTLGAHLENLTYLGSGSFNGRGNAQNNIVSGAGGDDFLAGGLGDDILNGGLGLDTAVMTGSSFEYTIENLGGGQFRITDNVGGRDGVDILNGMEEVRFANGVTGVLGGGAPAPLAPLEKQPGEPQILPPVDDDPFVPVKDVDLPEILPGIEDPMVLFDRSARDFAVPTTEWLMPSVTPETPDGPGTGSFGGTWSAAGWNQDGWLF